MRHVAAPLPIALLLALAVPLPRPVRGGERGARIVIDPGHGGAKEGAKGPGELWEKDIALQIAQQLRDRLEEAGSEVFLTREQDADAGRCRSAWTSPTTQRPDLFLSIHANSMPTKRMRERTEGIETYFLSANASGAGGARGGGPGERGGRPGQAGAAATPR